jgi:hypothetical protein
VRPRHTQRTGLGDAFLNRSPVLTYTYVQQMQVEERERRKEVEAIFRMMDTNSDGYLPVEVRLRAPPCQQHVPVHSPAHSGRLPCGRAGGRAGEGTCSQR